MFEEFWNLNTANNTLYIVLAIVAAAYLFRKYIGKSIASVFYNSFTKAGYQINKDAFFNLLIKPLTVFVMWVAIITALEKIKLPKSLADASLVAGIKVEQLIAFIFTTILIVVFCKFILGLVEYVAKILSLKASRTQDQADDQLIIFFKDFFKVIVIIVGVLMVLKFGLKQNIGNLLTGLSIVGAAIALATKESLENLIASFVIFFDKPFVTGDEVKVQSVSGQVEKIGLRSTRIRTSEKTYVTVPNKQMVDSIVDNHSARTKRKAAIDVEIATSASTDQLNNFKHQLQQWILANKTVIDHKVYFSAIVKGSYLYKVDLFTLPELSYDEYVTLKEQTNLEIIKLLLQNNMALTTANSN